MDREEVESVRREAIAQAEDDFTNAMDDIVEVYEDAEAAVMEIRDNAINDANYIAKTSCKILRYSDGKLIDILMPEDCKSADDEPLSDRIVNYVLEYLGGLEYDDFCKFYVDAEDVSCLKFGVADMLDDVEVGEISSDAIAENALREILESVAATPISDNENIETSLAKIDEIAFDALADLA